MFDDLQAERKKYSNYRLISIGIMILGLLLFLVPALNIVGVILLICGLLAIMITSTKIKKFDNEYKEKIINEILEEKFDKYHYSPESPITSHDYHMTEKQTGNRFYSNDYIEAELNGVKFDFSDVLVQQHTSNGKNSSTVTLFQGMYIRIYADYSLKGRLKVSERKQSKLFTGYKEVDLESIQFNKQFQVLADDKIDAFYILKPQVMEKIQDIENKYPGEFFIGFLNGIIYVTLSHKDSLEVSGKLGYTEAQKQEFTNEIDQITDIATFFNSIS